ncbi:MAG: hypothetical protein COZ69_14370 [Deltaproteobacteria bacterium CG_4_8_14_3_um_filter_45_9]|nr:MAG: hypothetical protein COS40_03185 [Deltaproteobacteria bacterium CG03_land_8_20_14_0_80_45_14]PIX21516.1 MAG: hypothetical protein COZ69_14370 [Deltaproteobacteria bacterium CG_4_8_14_3_um_filter_45_9]
MENRFTPYNPESPGLQTGDEGNFRSKDKEKLRPLGRGYTGFTIQSIERIFQHRFSFATRVQLLWKGRDSFQTIFDAVLAASYAGRAFFARLLRAGIEIYTYQEEMVHAKTYLFDHPKKFSAPILIDTFLIIQYSSIETEAILCRLIL